MNAPQGVDEASLTTFLTDRGIISGKLEFTLIAGGKSNLTYLVRNGVNEFVLRRPPLGHVLATAHDMAREYRVIDALGGTNVPVPDAVVFCEDEAVLGAPFYVMSKLEGVSYRSQQDLRDKEPTWVADVANAMMTTLAQLHHVDPRSVGLETFGKPEGYLARQVRTWGRQLDASRSRDIPGIDELRAAIEADVPSERRAAIVHGDYRLDNLLVADNGTVTGIVDWEMATLGDPLADIALTLAYVEVARRQREVGIFEGIADACTAPGFPSDDALITAYATAGGEEITAADLSWHLALSFYKLAAILEGIYLRHTNGQTVGDGFDSVGDIVPLAVSAGHDALKVRS